MPSTQNQRIVNYNYLNPVGFAMVIDRLPGVTYFCQEVNIPGFSSNNPQQANPFTRIPVPADFPDNENLSASFMVDEDLEGWKQIFEWYVGITFPERHEQYVALLNKEGVSPGKNKNVYSNISILVYTSHKNPKFKFTFHDALPVSLSGFNLSATTDDINPVTCQVTFDYSYFTFEKLE